MLETGEFLEMVILLDMLDVRYSKCIKDDSDSGGGKDRTDGNNRRDVEDFKCSKNDSFRSNARDRTDVGNRRDVRDGKCSKNDSYSSGCRDMQARCQR